MRGIDRSNLVQISSMDSMVRNILYKEYNVPHQIAVDIARMAKESTSGCKEFTKIYEGRPYVFGEYTVNVDGACDFVYLIIDKKQEHMVTLELEV